MVRVRYVGLSDPKAAFDALRAYRQQLIEMQMRYRPFSPDYLVLHEAQKALDRAAEHLTRDPRFYALRGHSS